jgi:hypothetical protein
MALPDGAQREHDPHRVGVEPALIGMGHDRGVHERGGGETIFMAEIGADQQLAGLAERRGIEIELARDLREAAEEDALDLPVALLEVAEHGLQRIGRRALRHAQHILDEPRRASGGQARSLPGQVKGAHDDAGRIGRQALGDTMKDLQGARAF